MKTLKMHDLIEKRILVTRSSARSIERDLANAIKESQGELTLDFSGIDGLTPSFFDEVLAIVDGASKAVNQNLSRVTVENPPTELSSKFLAVARGYGLIIKQSESGSWVISRQ